MTWGPASPAALRAAVATVFRGLSLRRSGAATSGSASTTSKTASSDALRLSRLECLRADLETARRNHRPTRAILASLASERHAILREGAK